MKSSSDSLLRRSFRSGVSRFSSGPLGSRIVAASSGGGTSLMSEVPSKRQNLRFPSAYNSRHLGHRFISSTYFHCNLFLKRAKPIAAGSEIFMKFGSVVYNRGLKGVNDDLLIRVLLSA